MKQIKGVSKVVSGYAGGSDPQPTYKKICDGSSDHAEVVQVSFDDSQVSYLDLLKLFYKSHDPTTLNRQGNDSGPQYRSIILYHDEGQKQTAQKLIDELNASVYGGKVTTKLQALAHFYPAEDYKVITSL